MENFNLQLMSPESFLFELWEADWWSILDLSFDQSLDFRNIIQGIKKYAVGYCEGSRLVVRPNATCYAVMFEKEGERFWFHIDKFHLKTYLEIHPL